MRKIIFLLLIAASVSGLGQEKTLNLVNVAKPKAGMREAFEASWKQHLDKYHKTANKIQVYQVTSGSANGSYVFIEGPFSYTDMDTERPNAREHLLDLDKNIAPKLEPDQINSLQGYRDTLSINPTPNGQKVLITVTVIKDGKADEYLAELRRTAVIATKIGSRISIQVNLVQQAGSTPTVITVRNLREGFRELEAGFLPPNIFRETYISQYGQDAWDKRLKILVDNVVSRQQHFEILRKDLSSN